MTVEEQIIDVTVVEDEITLNVYGGASPVSVATVASDLSDHAAAIYSDAHPLPTIIPHYSDEINAVLQVLSDAGMINTTWTVATFTTTANGLFSPYVVESADSGVEWLVDGQETQSQAAASFTLDGETVNGSTRALYPENINYLRVDGSSLTSLNLGRGSDLITRLYCDENALTTLDVSRNTALINLYCYRNSLTTLDVSRNSALTYLSAYTNFLTSLDLSSNTDMQYLFCYNNSLTSLDVTGCASLAVMNCSGNSLTTLDLSNNIALTSIYCADNQFSAAAVNQILVDMDAQNRSGGYTVSIEGTNAAPDGASGGLDGLTAKSNLESRGWTVTTSAGG